MTVSGFWIRERCSFPEKIDEHRDDDAQENGSSQGKVKGKVLPPDEDVPGQTAQPGDPGRYHQEKADGKEHGTEDDE